MTLLFFDFETTGLSPRDNFLLEVSWQPTTNRLTPLDGLKDFLLTPSIAAWTQIQEDSFIQDMHGASGLIDDLHFKSSVRPEDAEDAILETMRKVDQQWGIEPWYLAGNSVHFDRGFIEVHMPRLFERISHRIYDVTTLKIEAEANGRSYKPVTNPLPHRARHDVFESWETAVEIQSSKAV